MSPPERSPNSVRHVPPALDGSAPTAIEYAIIAVLLAAVAVGTWKTFGEPRLSEQPLPALEP
jgi:hypothetical protein